MAEKRMFSKKVTDSDSFIEMSSAAQSLYFHLNQSADDDGFNNQVQLAMMKAHASADDLKVLIAKQFVIRFESGVIVIKHWRLHNTLRKDRHTPTFFQEELTQLGISENLSYTVVEDGCQMVAKQLPDGCRSIDKISIDKNIPPISPKGGLTDRLMRDFESFWQAYPKKVGKSACQRKWKLINPSHELVEIMLKAIENQKTSENWTKEHGQYIPNPHTWLHQGRWEDEVEQKQSSNGNPWGGYPEL